MELAHNLPAGDVVVVLMWGGRFRCGSTAFSASTSSMGLVCMPEAKIQVHFGQRTTSQHRLLPLTIERCTNCFWRSEGNTDDWIGSMNPLCIGKTSKLHIILFLGDDV
jgi:hypothetical protein